MRQFTCLQSALLVSFLALVGCENQSSSTSLPSTTAPNDVDAVIDNVFENHNIKEEELTLTTDEVEQRFGVARKWTEFSIQEIGPGQYKGEATSPKGELLNVEVRQTANGIYARWRNADENGSGGALMTW